MKRIISIFVLAFSWNVFAVPLNCEIKLNNQSALKNSVQSVLNEKVLLGETQGIRAFVTEKGTDQYLLEAFLADYDVRIYGEGALKNSGDRITASLWGRDSIVDISCSQASPSVSTEFQLSFN